ncbi:hypothetical protein AB0B85_22050 [Micromonospora sp. NPDC049044]|uniref:hypothetical protein n=1 Tax=unclassified Micromonospora TaxID=2617518 RepID=UPI0033E76DB5
MTVADPPEGAGAAAVGVGVSGCAVGGAGAAGCAVGDAGAVVVGGGVLAVVGAAAAGVTGAPGALTGAVTPAGDGDVLDRATPAVTRAAVPTSVATSQPRPGRTVVSVVAPTTAAAANAASTSGRAGPDGPGQRRAIADGGRGTAGALGHGWG